MILGDAIQQFLQYVEFEKKQSIHTLTSYKTDLTQFEAFIQSTYQIEAVSAVTHQHVRSWLVHLMNEAVKNQPSAFPPIRPTDLISPNLAIPTTNVVNTRGEIIICTKRMNTVASILM